jgi:hypothetical protein
MLTDEPVIEMLASEIGSFAFRDESTDAADVRG